MVDICVDDVFDVVVFVFFGEVNDFVVGEFVLVVGCYFVVFGIELDDDVIVECCVCVL